MDLFTIVAVVLITLSVGVVVLAAIYPLNRR